MLLSTKTQLRRIEIGRLRIAWRSQVRWKRTLRRGLSFSSSVHLPYHFLLYLVLLLLLILFHHHHCACSHSIAGEQYGLRLRTIKHLVSLIAGRLQRILEDLLERTGPRLDQLAKITITEDKRTTLVLAARPRDEIEISKSVRDLRGRE